MAGLQQDSLLRILVSTDNHLGVWEKDEERKHDSFRAFEEVLQLAVEKNVDMLLLGGDLFHDNKPSRTTVIRAVELLNKYCLGDRPVQFQVLSDQKQNFVSGRVNFENPNLNVGLPVFTIHGNHDDPAGQDNLSAVDLLSSCGLVNYFGKVLLSGNNIGNITLSPVLIVKGDTKLALYGLGNVRDERLGRLFQTPGCVKWLRPASTEEIALEDWLNVFVLHQNRVQHGAAAKNCLQERHLPAFMDLVIWGHEHECIPEPQELQQPDSDGSEKAYVVQPGSSVATALSEGESKRKHVIMLELLENQWRTIKLPLSTVRPFKWDHLVLAAAQPPLDPEDSAAITAHLERKVNSMIQQALLESPNPPAAAAAAAVPNASKQQQQQQQGGQLLPLIRLRVDYTGFSTINSQRFGQKFVGKVANPQDMLLWAKAAARKQKQEGRADEEAAGALGLTSIRPEQLDQARIEDLVQANLTAQLDILPPEELSLALHNFVEKDEKQALADCVTTVLTETQAQAMSAPGAGLRETAAAAAADDADGLATSRLKDDDIANVVSMSVKSRQASRLFNPSGIAGTPSAAAGGVAAPLGASNKGGSGNLAFEAAGADDLDAMDMDDEPAAADENRRPAAAAAAGGGSATRAGMPPPAPKGRQRKGAATAAGGMRQAGLAEAFSRASQQQGGLRSPQGQTGSNLDGYLGFADGGAASTPSQTTSRSRGTAAGSAARAGRGRGGRGSRGGKAGGRAGRGKAAAAAEIDSDEEELVSEEGISSDLEDEPPAKKARGGAAARPKRAAASRKQTSYAEGEEDEQIIDSDDDDEQQQQQQQQTPAPTPGRRRGAAGGGASSSKPGGRQRAGHTQRSQQQALVSDNEHEGISDDDSLGGSRQTGRIAAAAGRHRGQAAAGTQATAATAGTAPQSIDGGYIDSDDDEPAPTPATAAAPRMATATGGRRRMLPASLGTQKTQR